MSSNEVHTMEGEVVQEDDTQGRDAEGSPPSPAPAPLSRGDMGPRVYERKIKDQEARLLARAVREGWNVSPKEKPKVVARMLRIVENGIDRDAVSAARALVSMEAQDMEARGEKQQGSTINYNLTQIIHQAGQQLRDASSLPPAEQPPT
jgi:hypothetical protein